MHKKRSLFPSLQKRDSESRDYCGFLHHAIMKKNSKEWAMICRLLIAKLFMVMAAAAGVREKAEAVEPIPTMSPPEGNTTFIEGRTWCVARPGASQFDLENAIAWACGLGGADCSAVQPGAACFRPDTLLAHASFAFNSYYQQNGNSDVACYFGGTAAVTARDPSYGSCKYLASETSAASRLFERDYLVKKLLEYEIRVMHDLIRVVNVLYIALVSCVFDFMI